MQRLGRWLLIGAVMSGVIPTATHAHPVRPRLYVSVDLSNAQRVKKMLLVEAPGGSPEAVIENAAIRSLSALKIFDFMPGTCPDAASRICQLRLCFVHEGRDWPLSELKLVAFLDVPDQAPRELSLGTVLQAYTSPARFSDASWLQRNIDERVAEWSPSVRRLFSLIPIEAKAARHRDRVTLTTVTYSDLSLAPDQAVFSSRDEHGGPPEVLFRVCDDLQPEGPVVDNPDLRCEEIRAHHDAPSRSTQHWPRVFLWHYSRTL